VFFSDTFQPRKKVVKLFDMSTKYKKANENEQLIKWVQEKPRDLQES
jgi:hypothetical protein